MQFWMIAALALIFLFFFAIDIRIMRKRRNNVGGIIKAFPCFLMLVFFAVLVFTSFIFPSGMLDSLDNSFADTITEAYQNTILSYLHLALILPVAICCGLLLFPKTLRQASVEYSHPQKDTKNQKAISYHAHFARFEEDMEVEEVIATRDIFRELGNNENDVRAYIERVVKKLKQGNR